MAQQLESLQRIKIDELIRSHRKTIGLKVTKDARLIVQAPFFMPENMILKLISRKESWIRSKQDFFKKHHNRHVRIFLPGEEFLFLGEKYPLTAVEDLPKAVILEEGVLKVSNLVLANVRDHLEHWYRFQALEYISQRVDYFARVTQLKYQSIRINQAATRWGSCGYRDTLNFTWRLIMAPANVVDYVVIHELMHLKQKNHSSKFWAEVENLWPNYKQDEKWLKEHGHLLNW